jgi:hypothetical protein
LSTIPPTSPHPSITRDWYNMPNSGRRTKWTQSHPNSWNWKENYVSDASFLMPCDSRDEKPSVRTTSIPVEIRNKYLLNRSPKHYRYPNIPDGYIYCFKDLFKLPTLAIHFAVTCRATAVSIPVRTDRLKSLRERLQRDDRQGGMTRSNRMKQRAFLQNRSMEVLTKSCKVHQTASHSNGRLSAR